MAINFEKKTDEKKYYYSSNGNTLGPFTINQLLERIDSNTLVYRDGVDWTTAKELDELKKFFKETTIIKEKTIIKEPDSSKSDVNNIFNENLNSIKQQMFFAPFSFNGRIRRKEYGISIIIYFVSYLIITAVSIKFSIFGLAFIPLFWFILAQGTKRCHDRNNSGWYQIIPFYFLWLLFAEGDNQSNEYGNNPKFN